MRHFASTKKLPLSGEPDGVYAVFSALAALLFPVAEIVGIGDLGGIYLAVLVPGGNGGAGLHGVGVRGFGVVHRALFGGLRLGLGCVLGRGGCLRCGFFGGSFCGGIGSLCLFLGLGLFVGFRGLFGLLGVLLDRESGG